MKISNVVFCILSGLIPAARADVSMSAIFGDHMVLQRRQANAVWGMADAGEAIEVSIAGQIRKTTAAEDGSWRLHLDPMEAGGPHELAVKGKNSLVFKDVLVGEVWMCSGQSNMAWPVNKSYHAEVEILSANYPHIRLITVPTCGTQIPQNSFDGEWKLCSPESVADFSAVGYFFGRRIHQALEVPVGLINNSWGGSSIEPWIPRDVLEKTGVCNEQLEHWDRQAAAYSDEIHAEKMAEYKAWQDAGRPGEWRRDPRDPRTGHHRPANIFNGMLRPVIGYGIRGVIWYQGESNTKRAYQYRELFPLMLKTWRELWGQGDLPFYWVQLANHKERGTEPADSSWAELREAQTMTLALPNTGEAVIIDTGEARNIHPRDKQTVADRLVRHALAKDYGFKIATESPRFASMDIHDSTVRLHFDHLSEEGLYAFDLREPLGFTIAGEDRVFVPAEAKIVDGKCIDIRSDRVPSPVAVRYAWADNPAANVYDRNGLPLTPFRTDDWQGITFGVTTPN